MNHLRDAFLDLPTWQGAACILAAVLVVVLVALIVQHFAFKAGERAAEFRFNRIREQRRRLESIEV